ncbi:MAG: hypothetical protein WD557_18335 [Dehalococcoidia bacterium]
MLAAVLTLSVSVWVACSNDDGSDPGEDVPTAAVAGVTETGPDYASSGGDQGMSHDSAVMTPAVAEFHDAMRKLWEDHVTWTRLFIVSAVADLPDSPATTERLLQNQTDIGDAIKPFYGEDAGNQLTVLLKEHITTAATLLGAAKAGDSAAVTASSASWYDNADRIAAFLSGANPDNWPESDATAMMREHLDLTLEEAVAHLTGDYATDIAAYDKIHVQILEMADMLSDGIVAQFPERFE